MAAEEMELDQVIQLCQLQAAELEIKDSKLHQISSALEIIMQMTYDERFKSEDYFERKRLHNEWNGMNRFKKELDKIMEGEG